MPVVEAPFEAFDDVNGDRGWRTHTIPSPATVSHSELHQRSVRAQQAGARLGAPRAAVRGCGKFYAADGATRFLAWRVLGNTMWLSEHVLGSCASGDGGGGAGAGSTGVATTSNDSATPTLAGSRLCLHVAGPPAPGAVTGGGGSTGGTGAHRGDIIPSSVAVFAQYADGDADVEMGEHSEMEMDQPPPRSNQHLEAIVLCFGTYAGVLHRVRFPFASRLVRGHDGARAGGGGGTLEVASGASSLAPSCLAGPLDTSASGASVASVGGVTAASTDAFGAGQGSCTALDVQALCAGTGGGVGTGVDNAQGDRSPMLAPCCVHWLDADRAAIATLSGALITVHAGAGTHIECLLQSLDGGGSSSGNGAGDGDGRGDGSSGFGGMLWSALGLGGARGAAGMDTDSGKDPSTDTAHLCADTIVGLASLPLPGAEAVDGCGGGGDIVAITAAGFLRHFSGGALRSQRDLAADGVLGDSDSSFSLLMGTKLETSLVPAVAAELPTAVVVLQAVRGFGLINGSGNGDSDGDDGRSLWLYRACARADGAAGADARDNVMFSFEEAPLELSPPPPSASVAALRLRRQQQRRASWAAAEQQDCEEADEQQLLLDLGAQYVDNSGYAGAFLGTVERERERDRGHRYSDLEIGIIPGTTELVSLAIEHEPDTFGTQVTSLWRQHCGTAVIVQHHGIKSAEVSAPAEVIGQMQCGVEHARAAAADELLSSVLVLVRSLTAAAAAAAAEQSSATDDNSTDSRSGACAGAAERIADLIVKRHLFAGAEPVHVARALRDLVGSSAYDALERAHVSAAATTAPVAIAGAHSMSGTKHTTASLSPAAGSAHGLQLRLTGSSSNDADRIFGADAGDGAAIGSALAAGAFGADTQQVRVPTAAEAAAMARAGLSQLARDSRRGAGAGGLELAELSLSGGDDDESELVAALEELEQHVRTDAEVRAQQQAGFGQALVLPGTAALAATSSPAPLLRQLGIAWVRLVRLAAQHAAAALTPVGLVHGGGAAAGTVLVMRSGSTSSAGGVSLLVPAAGAAAGRMPTSHEASEAHAMLSGHLDDQLEHGGGGGGGGLGAWLGFSSRGSSTNTVNAAASNDIAAPRRELLGAIVASPSVRALLALARLVSDGSSTSRAAWRSALGVAAVVADEEGHESGSPTLGALALAAATAARAVDDRARASTAGPAGHAARDEVTFGGGANAGAVEVRRRVMREAWAACAEFSTALRSRAPHTARLLGEASQGGATSGALGLAALVELIRAPWSLRSAADNGTEASDAAQAETDATDAFDSGVATRVGVDAAADAMVPPVSASAAVTATTLARAAGTAAEGWWLRARDICVILVWLHDEDNLLSDDDRRIVHDVLLPRAAQAVRAAATTRWFAALRHPRPCALPPLAAMLGHAVLGADVPLHNLLDGALSCTTCARPASNGGGAGSNGRAFPSVAALWLTRSTNWGAQAAALATAAINDAQEAAAGNDGDWGNVEAPALRGWWSVLAHAHLNLAIDVAKRCSDTGTNGDGRDTFRRATTEAVERLVRRAAVAFARSAPYRSLDDGAGGDDNDDGEDEEQFVYTLALDDVDGMDDGMADEMPATDASMEAAAACVRAVAGHYRRGARVAASYVLGAGAAMPTAPASARAAIAALAQRLASRADAACTRYFAASMAAATSAADAAAARELLQGGKGGGGGLSCVLRSDDGKKDFALRMCVLTGDGDCDGDVDTGAWGGWGGIVCRTSNSGEHSASWAWHSVLLAQAADSAENPQLLRLVIDKAVRECEPALDATEGGRPDDDADAGMMEVEAPEWDLHIQDSRITAMDAAAALRALRVLYEARRSLRSLAFRCALARAKAATDVAAAASAAARQQRAASAAFTAREAARAADAAAHAVKVQAARGADTAGVAAAAAAAVASAEAEIRAAAERARDAAVTPSARAAITARIEAERSEAEQRLRSAARAVSLRASAETALTHATTLALRCPGVGARSAHLSALAAAASDGIGGGLVRLAHTASPDVAAAVVAELRRRARVSTPDRWRRLGDAQHGDTALSPTAGAAALASARARVPNPLAQLAAWHMQRAEYSAAADAAHELERRLAQSSSGLDTSTSDVVAAAEAAAAVGAMGGAGRAPAHADDVRDRIAALDVVLNALALAPQPAVVTFRRAGLAAAPGGVEGGGVEHVVAVQTTVATIKDVQRRRELLAARLAVADGDSVSPRTPRDALQRLAYMRLYDRALRLLRAYASGERANGDEDSICAADVATFARDIARRDGVVASERPLRELLRVASAPALHAGAATALAAAEVLLDPCDPSHPLPRWLERALVGQDCDTESGPANVGAGSRRVQAHGSGAPSFAASSSDGTGAGNLGMASDVPRLLSLYLSRGAVEAACRVAMEACDPNMILSWREIPVKDGAPFYANPATREVSETDPRDELKHAWLPYPLFDSIVEAAGVKEQLLRDSSGGSDDIALDEARQLRLQRDALEQKIKEHMFLTCNKGAAHAARVLAL